MNHRMRVRRPCVFQRNVFPGVCLVVLLLLPLTAAAQVVITLNNTFIEEFKDRATIDTMFTVDRAHAKPNSPSKDGDLHVAGRAPEVQLPIVAELMNAKAQKPAMKRIHSVEGGDEGIAVAGAWRLWSEHGGESHQVQGKALKRFTKTNPDHVFEIHPITKVDDFNVAGSFRPIRGFKPKDAENAFTKYESKRCKIVPGANGTTTIVTSMVGFNYVEFIMEVLDEQPHVQPPDGRFVFASVHALNGELLVHKRRMVFVEGTPPARAVAGLKAGDRLHVLGIPRISLKLISWRIEHFKDDEFKDLDMLNWDLPYEMIIVAVYPR